MDEEKEEKEEEFGEGFSFIKNYYHKKSIRETLEDLLRESPWWLISFVVHVLIIIILMQIAYVVTPPEKEELVITTDMTEEKPPKFDPQKMKELFKEEEPEVEETTEVEEEVETPTEEAPQDLVEDVEENFLTEAEDNSVSQEAIGLAPEVPIGGEGGVQTIGVGGGLGNALAARKSRRSRRRALKKYGGGPDVEKAVEAALRWLARNQERDGHWDCQKHGGKGAYDVGVTGLALLAFLGAGHTEISGKYRKVVKKAVNWLIRQQKTTGDITVKDSFSKNLYNHGIATFALCEEYAMTQNPRLKGVCERALKYIFRAQNPEGGWDYTYARLRTTKPGPGGNPIKCAPYWRSDTSVTGWQAMAIKSAKIGRLKVNDLKIKKMLQIIKKHTHPDTKCVGYTSTSGSLGMAAVGMCIKQFFGMPKTHEELVKPADRLIRSLPRWGRLRKHFDPKTRKLLYIYREGVSYYYWYYASLVLFQMGGKWWRIWNPAMKKILLEHQIKGGVNDGSWDPISGHPSHSGGRVYSTAICCLTLEVYWRYMPIYR